MRRICFVTGTRAEFGLMHSVLAAIRARRGVQLQIVATGMHLDRIRGRTVEDIRANAIVPWRGASPAAAVGIAVTHLSVIFEKLKSDVVLVVGDRVEAFAGATAGHLSNRVVAHIHGGDRAWGQVDDSLRHAITKLAHVHFPATQESARRIIQLGEDEWRVHTVGSPGIDSITQMAAPWEEIVTAVPGLVKKQYALAVLHPMDADEDVERKRAQQMLNGVFFAGMPKVVAIYPNNDPGAGGIIYALHQAEKGERCVALPNVPREIFLGLLRDAAFLIGNSSAGIIEAGSFGTPVIDIGDRQRGRERPGDVVHIPYGRDAAARAVRKILKSPPRQVVPNPYAGTGAGKKIADILGRITINQKLLHKLIAY